MFLILVAGVLGGVGLALLLAPGSKLVYFVGFMTSPLIFGAGYKVWQTQAVIITLRHLGARRIGQLIQAILLGTRAKLREALPDAAEAGVLLQQVYQRTSGFLYAGLIVGAVGGSAAGVWSEAGFHAAFLAFTCLGGVYGFLLMRLASRGALPPPEE